jgi:ADP-ribosylglycohydrolase
MEWRGFSTHTRGLAESRTPDDTSSSQRNDRSNHPEGIKGAQATAVAIFLARTGSDKAAIRWHIEEKLGYDLSQPLDVIRDTYTFDVSCQGSVPQSIISFLEAEDFEDAVRNAISLGGDSDTMACIACGIADAFWGVPHAIERESVARLAKQLRGILGQFVTRFRNRVRPG